MITETARQALGRPLTDVEEALADAMTAHYGKGSVDFGELCESLNMLSVDRPSGGTEPWTVEILEAELKAINDDLDAAYEREGLVASDWNTGLGWRP